MQTGGGQIWAALLLQSREVDGQTDWPPYRYEGFQNRFLKRYDRFYNGTMVQD